MEIEINKRNNFIQTRVNNGSKGGRPKEYEKPTAKPLGYPKNNLIANANGNGIINEDSNTEINYLLFDEFRKLYPGTKRGNQTEFDNYCKKHKDWLSCLQLLKTAISNQIDSRENKKNKGEFVPEWKNLQTWINQRCWEEEIIQLQLINKPKHLIGFNE
jgi:hypothetical protein